MIYPSVANLVPFPLTRREHYPRILLRILQTSLSLKFVPPQFAKPRMF